MKTPTITYQNKLFNSQSKKLYRRNLRKLSTQQEKILWKFLRNRQHLNLKFRRQYIIGKYITDFYRPELKLAIEIDGANHFFDAKSTAYDLQRQRFIESKGIRVLRFSNPGFLENIEGVLQTIAGVSKPPPAFSRPSLERRGKCLK